MKRDEKNLQSRQKILDAALREFGEKPYAEASLNAICAEGGISKGIIYHYFKDKDALFLACVQACFDALTNHIRASVTGDRPQPEVALVEYFDARVRFFDENPQYFNLFFGAAVLPPQHLASAIAAIRADFDALNVQILTALLGQTRLRGDVTLEEVIETFRLYQDVLHTHYQTQGGRMDLAEHERRCSRTLNILLYGVVERNQA